jgi:hypothetical protein
MTPRRFVRAAGLGVFFLLTTVTAFAQDPAAPPVGPQPGICAPWHRCLAFGLVGLVVLACLAWLAGFMIQRKGFDKLVHRQGQPGGVKVDE